MDDDGTIARIMPDGTIVAVSTDNEVAHALQLTFFAGQVAMAGRIQAAIIDAPDPQQVIREVAAEARAQLAMFERVNHIIQ